MEVILKSEPFAHAGLEIVRGHLRCRFSDRSVVSRSGVYLIETYYAGLHGPWYVGQGQNVMSRLERYERALPDASSKSTEKLVAGKVAEILNRDGGRGRVTVFVSAHIEDLRPACRLTMTMSRDGGRVT